MAEEFHCRDDARLYLHETVCLWEGSPCIVYVDAGLKVASATTVKIRHLVSSKEELVDYTDKRFSYSAFPIGYVNFAKNVYYLARLPWRKVKQGLHPENCRAYLCGDFANKHLSTNSILYSPEMGRSIMGDFPSESSVLVSLISNFDKESIAVSRSIALKKEGSKILLFFKNNLVGDKNMTDPHFTMYSEEYNSHIQKTVGRYVCLI